MAFAADAVKGARQWCIVSCQVQGGVFQALLSLLQVISARLLRCSSARYYKYWPSRLQPSLAAPHRRELRKSAPPPGRRLSAVPAGRAGSVSEAGPGSPPHLPSPRGRDDLGIAGPLFDGGLRDAQTHSWGLADRRQALPARAAAHRHLRFGCRVDGERPRVAAQPAYHSGCEAAADGSGGVVHGIVAAAGRQRKRAAEHVGQGQLTLSCIGVKPSRFMTRAIAATPAAVKVLAPNQTLIGAVTDSSRCMNVPTE